MDRQNSDLAGPPVDPGFGLRFEEDSPERSDGYSSGSDSSSQGDTADSPPMSDTQTPEYVFVEVSLRLTCYSTFSKTRANINNLI